MANRFTFGTTTGNSLGISSPGAVPGPSPSRRMTASGTAVQAKLSGPDKWGVSVWACSRHNNIEYKTKTDRGVCPLCEEQAKNDIMRAELKKVTGALDLLKRDAAKLRMQLSSLDAMRESVSEVNDEDAMFLKELIYRYRANPKQVRVTQKIAKREIRTDNGTAIRHDVVGWDVVYMDGPEREFMSHAAKSVGGKMMALQFSEIMKLSGLPGAMTALMKALSGTMANVDE